MVELMVVVIIISVVAALSIPNITRRMQERRASEAAQRVALMYQTARARAMGRGTAVLVRYTQPTSQGALEMLEAQRGVGVGAGCETLPVSSCSDTDWDVPALRQFRPVTSLDLGRRAEYDRVQITMRVDGAAPSFLDVCFTPMGRTFVRTATGLGFHTMSGAYEAQVTRANSASRMRSVMILPNGAARLQ
jgi:type IV fimbrial biogenesis protein FimT